MKYLAAALLLAAPVMAEEVRYETLEMRGHREAPGVHLVQIARRPAAKDSSKAPAKKLKARTHRSGNGTASIPRFA